MFVVAMKTTRARLAVWGVVLMVLFAVTFAAARRQPTAVATAAGGDTGRVALLRELGYEVTSSWTGVWEVAIPAELDEAWTAYNELQKAAGYDLTPYLGERVKCYTYDVGNYPGCPETRANLYEYDGTVIAGDVSATGAEGFSHGLTACPQEQGEANGEIG